MNKSERKTHDRTLETLTVQSIRGYVVAGGERFEGTGLELEPYDKKTRSVESRVSRADGTFEFLNVPPGRYYLRAALSGFDPVTAFVRVEPPLKWPSPAPYLKFDLRVGSRLSDFPESTARLATSIPRVKSGGQ